MRTISAVWSSWGPSPQLRTFSNALCFSLGLIAASPGGDPSSCLVSVKGAGGWWVLTAQACPYQTAGRNSAANQDCTCFLAAEFPHHTWFPERVKLVHPEAWDLSWAKVEERRWSGWQWPKNNGTHRPVLSPIKLCNCQANCCPRSLRNR